mmetsp:Transcript_17023/g.40804  ORF Transcript_17023/g.40804 Transcript_17023/m.40804 type:complete len:282 (-) Transcript_17023:462-1307(-)
MKSVLVLLAVFAAPAHAWIGRSLSDLPILNKSKSNYPARPFPARESSIDGIMAKKRMDIRGGSSLEMSLDTNPIITSLIPRIGIVTSTLLYFSPMAAVRAASKDNTLGDLNPVPLAIMAVSSICWLAYGLSIQDPYVTLSNVPGCIVAIWYVTAVLPLLKGSQLQTTQNIVVVLSAVTINLWAYLSLTKKAMVQVRSALGLYASALFVVLSGSPLSTIKTVLSTRNSGTILTPLTIAQVTNCGLWSAYGLAIKDKFVYGPNLTGFSFGLVQLVLKLWFPSK